MQLFLQMTLMIRVNTVRRNTITKMLLNAMLLLILLKKLISVRSPQLPLKAGFLRPVSSIADLFLA